MTWFARVPRHAVVLLAALGAVALLAGCASSGALGASGGGQHSGRFEASAITPPTERPNFTLTDTSGHQYNFRQKTAGKTTLLYFGYTHCPDVCPINMAQIHAVLATGAVGDPIVVFVTVDPTRDTPERLRSWLDKIDPSFIGLVGTTAQVQAAERAAGVPLAVKQGSGPNYTMGHAAQILTYAPDNKGYVQFPFGTRQSTMVHDLKALEQIPPATSATSTTAAGGGAVATPAASTAASS